MPGQSLWMCCQKCRGMIRTGNPTIGLCFAGGVHDHTGSLDFALKMNEPAAANEQANWRRCTKCQGLAFAGSSTCPAGGSHSPDDASKFVLPLNVRPGSHQQDKWMHCNRCQGLVFTGGPTGGKCVSGQDHQLSGSGNYAPFISQNVLKLFQRAVSTDTDNAKQLQVALTGVRDKAAPVVTTAQQASHAGAKAIGGAAGNLATALGNAQSTPPQQMLSTAKDLNDKIQQQANSLGQDAAEAKSRSEDLETQIKQMVDLWGRVHDPASLKAAIDQTTSVANAVAGLLGFLGAILAPFAPPLGAALVVAAGVITAAAALTNKVANQADSLVNPQQAPLHHLHPLPSLDLTHRIGPDARTGWT